jgi:predicted ATPase
MHGFVQEEEPPTLITADRPFEKGDVSTVARREGVATWTSVLYIRGELVTVQKNLDSFMNDKTLNQLYITGPSGCGKTSFLYLWARRLSVLQKKRVLIIQFREGQSSFIWIREENGVIWRMNQHIAQSKLQQEVEEIIK